MGKVVFGIIGLIIGALGGTMFGGSMLAGSAAGVGIATGLSAGICSTVIAAEEEGLLTPEQVNQVLARAATDMGASVPDDAALVDTKADCEAVMQKLRDAASQ